MRPNKDIFSKYIKIWKCPNAPKSLIEAALIFV